MYSDEERCKEMVDTRVERGYGITVVSLTIRTSPLFSPGDFCPGFTILSEGTQEIYGTYEVRRCIVDGSCLC